MIKNNTYEGEMNMEYVEVLQKQRIEVLDHIHRLEDATDDLYFQIDECVDGELKQSLESQAKKNETSIDKLDDKLMAICFKIDGLAESTSIR